MEALLGYELVQVACGASHVVAVTNEREVFAWGRGDNGMRNEPAPFFCFDCTVERLRWWFMPRASEHSRIVGSLSRRSPRAGHPRHPQLSPAGVFACGIWGAEGGVWGGLLHDYQQPEQHNGMWKQQVIILPLNPKQWLCELMPETVLLLKRHCVLFEK